MKPSQNIIKMFAKYRCHLLRLVAGLGWGVMTSFCSAAPAAAGGWRGSALQHSTSHTRHQQSFPYRETEVGSLLLTPAIVQHIHILLPVYRIDARCVCSSVLLFLAKDEMTLVIWKIINVNLIRLLNNLE